MLNFGHTIGHAIERSPATTGGSATARPSPWEWSPRAGWPSDWAGCAATSWTAGPVTHERFGLPIAARARSRRLMSAMSRDKKNRLGRIRFVLPRSIGKVEFTDAAG